MGQPEVERPPLEDSRGRSMLRRYNGGQRSQNSDKTEGTLPTSLRIGGRGLGSGDAISRAMVTASVLFQA